MRCLITLVMRLRSIQSSVPPRCRPMLSLRVTTTPRAYIAGRLTSVPTRQLTNSEAVKRPGVSQRHQILEMRRRSLILFSLCATVGLSESIGAQTAFTVRATRLHNDDLAFVLLWGAPV